MHHATSSFASTMTTFAQRMLMKPWQYLALLLLGMPLAWAAGVSISNVKITTLKQIAFADAQASITVGEKITRTAIVKLSPGPVRYSSGDRNIATVNETTGEVTGVLAGTTTITATQLASPPYPQASASYTITVVGQAVAFDDWQVNDVPFGAADFQINAPTSNVTQAGGTPTIRYSTLDGNTSVVSITESGMVTVKAAGTATIVAEQAPTGTFAGGKTQTTFHVTAIKSTFTWVAPAITLHQTLTLTDPTDSNNKHPGGTFSYAFKPDQTGRTVATISDKQLTATAGGTGLITVTQAAAGNYDTTSIDVPFSVELPTFTITGFTFNERTFDAVNRANNTFALPTLDKPAGSSQNYVFAVDPADAAKATIANGFITVDKPGKIRITATLPEDPAVHQLATADAILSVLQATPEITLSAVDRTTSDASTFAIPVASTNQDAATPVMLELVNVQPTGFATLSQDAATRQWSAHVTGAGTATLVATQATNEEFVAGRKEVAFAINSSTSLQPNTLALAAFDKLSNAGPFIPPWTAAVGDTSTIEVTVVNGATTVATVGADKQTITLTGLVGDAQVTLKQPAQNGFQPADVTATLRVLPAPYTITGLSNITRDYDPFVLANNRFDLPELAKPAGSTAEYTFSSSDTNVASIQGRTVTVHKPTTGMNPTYIDITANLPADPQRHQAASVTVKLTVKQATPTMTLGRVDTHTGAGQVDISVASNSDAPITLTLTDASTPGFVTLTQKSPTVWTAAINAVGTGTLTATQPASASGVFTAGSVTAPISVTAAQTQQPTTLAFTPEVIPKVYGDGDFTPEVFTPSGLQPTFTIAPADAAVAQVDSTGRVITIKGAGTATITATVSSASFATTTATATLKVSQRAPGLNLTGALVRAVGAGAFDLNLSTLSSGPLSVTSSDNGIATATIVGTPPGSSLIVRVTPVKQGNVTLTIHQDADTNHTAADIAPVVSLNTAQASITWPLPGEIVYTGAPTTVNLPAATSSNTVTPITYAVSPSSSASLNGTALTVSSLGTGSITLTATRAEGNGYAATQFVTTLPVVSTPSGTLAVTQLVAPDTFQASAGSKFTIPFQSNSDPALAPVMFLVATGGNFVEKDSTDPTGWTLIARLAGDATVVLSQQETATHTAASQVVKVTVTGSDPITSWQDPIEVTFDDSKSVIEIPRPQSSSNGAFTYSVDPSGSGIAKVVNGNMLQLLGAGNTTLLVQQAAHGSYPGDQLTTRLIVHPQANGLVFNTYGLDLDTQGRVVRYPTHSSTFNATATSTTSSRGKIGYSSTRRDVATIDPATGLVTVTGPGETTLTASQEAWSGFAGAQAQLQLKVEANAPRLTLSPFELPKGSSAVPPYQTDAPADRPVVVSVSDGSYATVGPDQRTLTAVTEGTVSVTVTLLATATQPKISVSAPLNITARVPRLSVQPAEIRHAWTGSEQKITLVPTSDNNTGSAYTLTSSDAAVASVNGLEVTLKEPANGQSSSATLWLSQAAGNGWGPARVEVPVQVTVQPDITDLADMTRKYSTPDFDLPDTLNGETVAYTSGTQTVATIIGSRKVHLSGIGDTRLEARNASGGLVKAVTLTVERGDPVLALQGVDLPSTTIDHQMTASRKGDGSITYSIVSGDAADITPDGLLLVKRPGTVTVQAAVAQSTNFTIATTTAQVSIADGLPGLRVTAWPTSPVDVNETWEIRYVANFTQGDVMPILLLDGLNLAPGELVAQALPPRAGEEGYIRFRPSSSIYRQFIKFTLNTLSGNDYSGIYFDAKNDPRWTRTIEFKPFSPPQTSTNLGPAIVLTYDPSRAITLPNTYDDAGNVVTGNLNCGTDFRVFDSSNQSVLAIGQHPQTHQDDGFYMVGVGQTTLSCRPSSPIVPHPVQVTVLQASPRLQAFNEVTLDTASQPVPLIPPSSLNKVTPFTYRIVNDDDTPSQIATVTPDGKVVPNPNAQGTAWIVATQTTSPSDVYMTDSIRARLTVNQAVPKTFATIYATYGDAAFPVPRPADIPVDVSLTYRFKPDGQTVADIVSGNIQIRNAGTVDIEALQGSTVVARGQLVVDKAPTQLTFRLQPQVFFVDFCLKTFLTWPIANQPEGSSDVKGLLSTNNPEGAIKYHGIGLYQFLSDPYYRLNVFANSGIPSPYPVWVTQEETANYYGATSETLTYQAYTATKACSQ